MPKYKVQITKYIEHCATEEVEAINDMEARKAVRMMAIDEDRDNVKRLFWSENEKPRFKLEIIN